MCKLAVAQGIFQRLRNMCLPDYIFESGGAVFSCGNNKLAHAVV
jgi:hypothetical protein